MNKIQKEIQIAETINKAKEEFEKVQEKKEVEKTELRGDEIIKYG